MPRGMPWRSFKKAVVIDGSSTEEKFKFAVAYLYAIHKTPTQTAIRTWMAAPNTKLSQREIEWRRSVKESRR